MRSPNVSRSANVFMVPDPANLAARALPVFPCPAGNFGKTKSGTAFGKVALSTVVATTSIFAFPRDLPNQEAAEAPYGVLLA